MYLWVKSFHLIAVVCWFAGLFYLPRLFVYHSMDNLPETIERFKVMERKLYRGIMTPSAVLTIGLGLWLLKDTWAVFKSQGWLHVKLSMVLLLVIYHHMCGRYLRAFAEGKNKHSHKYFRVFNEVPVLMLVVIVVMVIVKPF